MRRGALWSVCTTQGTTFGHISIFRRLMPCPFTCPKMFWAGSNILWQTKRWFAFSKIGFCASTKVFQEDTKCSQIFCTRPKIYLHIVAVTKILCQTKRWFAFSKIGFCAGTKVFECLVLLQVPKCFVPTAGPTFLSKLKNLTALSAFSKTNSTECNHLFVWHKIFVTATICK